MRIISIYECHFNLQNHVQSIQVVKNTSNDLFSQLHGTTDQFAIYLMDVPRLERSP